MKKTLIYLLLLVLVGAGVWYFLGRDDDNVFSARETAFAIPDTASIGRIFIAGNEGNTIMLERGPDGWLVNKTYRVMKAPLETLLETIRRQKAAYPVPSNMHNDVVQALASDGLKVEIYDRSGQKLRSFFVGSEGPDFDGNFMLMEGAKRPLVVRLAGHMGYLRPRYSTNLMEWRDRHVFEVPAQDIREVSIRYEKLPEWSFTMTRQPGGLTVTNSAAPAGAPLNQKRAEDYLGFFKNLNSENYVNGTLGLDTVIATSDKFCTIDLETAKGKQHADIYYMDINVRSKNLAIDDAGNINEPYDRDRFYAIINGGKDTAVIQMYTFEKVFRHGAEFFAQDSVKR